MIQANTYYNYRMMASKGKIDLAKIDQLLFSALKLLTQGFSEIETKIRVTRPEYFCLAWVAENPGNRLSDLACAMELDVSTVSRCLAPLTARGLVAKKHIPEDMRAYSVELTDLGRTYVEELRRKIEQKLEIALSAWEKEDIEGLIKYLEKLSKDLATSVTKEKIEQT